MAGFTFPDEDGGKPQDEAEQAAVDSGGLEATIGGADDETPVEVAVVDDTPAEDRGRKPLDREVADPTDEELANYSAGVQKRIKDLTHKQHDERRRADALQRERDELERVARAALVERDNMRKRFKEGATIFAKQAEESVEGQIAAAKAKLKQAHEAFDTDAIVDAQAELSELMQRKVLLKSNTKDVDSLDTESDVQSPPTDSPPPRPQLDEKTRKWMDRNNWFGDQGDEAMTGFALGLHRKLVKEHGTSFASTDDYYAQIDAEMRKTFPAYFKSSTSSPRAKSSVVAPASRTLAPRKITLTQTQVALAKRFGLTPEQYAREVAKLNQGE